MRNDTTRVHSAQGDQIDFRVSNSFREHYAAQGLTYDIGRRQPNARPRIPDWNDEIHEAQKVNRDLQNELRLQRLEYAEAQRELATLRRENAELRALRNLPSPSLPFKGIVGPIPTGKDLNEGD